MTDYTIFYKSQLSVVGNWSKENEWDLFISAYNSSKRVSDVFAKVRAGHKSWLLFPEYNYAETEYSGLNNYYAGAYTNEADYILGYVGTLNLNLSRIRICIDLTGFIRPYQLFLTKLLWERGVKRFDALYSEPNVYKEREKTKFSSGAGGKVRQVAGFEGAHSANTSNDMLIIGSGYDDELIARVSYYKDAARKIQIFGLPSLRADMYQENELRAQLAEESLGPSLSYFAPANDPFVTASVLSEITRALEKQKQITNLYLSPLASKAQVLGFSLFHYLEGKQRPTSIIYPFRPHYSRETTEGLSRIWKYTVEV